MDPDETVKIMAPGHVAFDRFRLVKRVGRGGMGIVWLARDQTLDLDVALKFLPDTVRSDPSALDDLKSEARKSLRLSHPNIVRIHDFIENEESVAISMEFVDGATLAELRIRQERKVFEIHEIEDWVAQLCDSLSYAHHDAKLVHRDLKPTNLMVAKDGRLKVTDFGISRSLSDTITRLTRENVVAGTLVYMGPQQLLGHPADPRDDVYSLGATLYELLTGKPPFYSGDITAQIETCTPPPVTQRRQELKFKGNSIHEDWETTISACLEKDPTKRPQTTAEVAARLKLRSSSGNYVILGQSRGSDATRKSTLISWRAMLGVSALTILFLGYYFRMFEAASRNAESAPTDADGSTQAELSPPGIGDFLRDLPLLATPRIVGASAGQPYTNTLGMVLLPVSHFYVSIWETRVKDYQEYCRQSGVEPASGGIRVLTANGWMPDSKRSWENPGIPQTPENPVCGVNIGDASAFCQWLTQTERDAGRLSPGQYYRLPFDEEWIAAAGPHPHPWDPNLMPQGNFAGSEASEADGWQSGRSTISWLRDEFPRTAPAGQFLPNDHGLFDLGGNVWEWCLDADNGPNGHLRGGSWDSNNEEYFLAESFVALPSDNRNTTVGFRVFLVEVGEESAPAKP